MKRILLSLLLVFTNFLCQAQANVTSTAISVQGIARDAQNNARINTSISITAELYYVQNNSPVNILTRTGTVSTDAFGVFAYVVDIASADFVKITNSEAWIKISSGGVTFAQEKLMAVPYALHAQNGAPTGSIMPYVGTTAPAGWLLCDGSAIPAGVFYDQLRIILGGTAGDNSTRLPDLRGLFLRGAGNQTVNSVSIGGNTLRTIQDQQVGSHNHAQQGTLTTSSNGAHQHNIYTWQGGNILSSQSGATIKAEGVEPVATGNNDAQYSTDQQGAHTHTVTLSGNTAANSGTDTRPVNFGVNYIIKI